MRRFAKTAVIAAALVMSMSMLSGCGSKKETGKVETTTTESTEAVDTSSMSIDEYIDYYSKDVTLGDYKGIEYTYTQHVVSADEVQKVVDDLISSATTYDEDKESAAKNGDTVNIDFVGSVDGVEFDGGNSGGSGYDLELGSNSFIDDFEAQIEGHVPGDTFDVEVTFPDDYNTEELAGKDAVFATTLNYIKVPIVPEYNDEMVAANTEYSNVSDYEASVKTDLENQYESSALSSAQSDVMVKTVANASFASISQTEIDTQVNKIKEALQTQADSYGIDYTTYIYYYYGYDNEDDFNTYINSVCEDSQKEKMVVCAIAKAEGITITDEDQDAFVKEIAEENDVTEDNVREYYSASDIMYYTLSEKIMNFLMENAVKNEVTTEATTEEATEKATEAADDATEAADETTEEATETAE